MTFDDGTESIMFSWCDIKMWCEKTVDCGFRFNTEKVDVSDLTWDQKEKVLRYLFARMNRMVSTPDAAAGKKIAAKPAEEQAQPSLMDQEAWLVLHVIYILSNNLYCDNGQYCNCLYGSVLCVFRLI